MAKDTLPPLDFDLAIRRLKKDLRDDWFPDPLNYSDLLSAAVIRQHFAADPLRLRGQQSEQFNLPKQSFTLRYSLETSVFDRVLYQALADKLIEQYDPLLDTRVASHRLSTRDKRYMFHNGVEAWKSHIDAVKAELDNTSHVLLVTDISNYFECISIDELENSLRRAEPAKHPHISAYIGILIDLLRQWSPYKDVGVPQNRDPSSFLANIYLRDIDADMRSKGYNYFRYMDDIKIVCNNEYHARRALKELVILLRQKRLNVNSRKTKILVQGSREFNEVIPPPNRILEEIDALWRQRTLVGIRASVPRLREFADVLVAEQRTDTREFRFCIPRLEKIARCKAIGFDFSGIIGPIVGLLSAQPWASDMAVRLLSSVDLTDEHLHHIAGFLVDPSRNIYEWQGYLLWQLLTMATKQRRSGSPELRKFAKKTLDEPWDPPMKAGAILYLGACGTDSDCLYVLKNFRGTSSRLVIRSTLIATKECLAADLKKYLLPYLPDEDVEIASGLRSKAFKGAYFEPPPALQPQELYDDLPNIYGF